MRKELETVRDFIFLGSKVTADGECSPEIKRCLLLGRKAMTNLDSILKKQRHYFANKGPSCQSYGFSSGHVWMWEMGHKESWAPKNWCFWTMVLEKNQSILKEINPEYSLEGLMLKLKLQYFGHLIRRGDSLEIPWCWERLKMGEEGDDRGWDGWMASLTRWTWVWASSETWWWTGRPGMQLTMGSQRVGHGWVTELNLECLLGPTIELVIAGCIKSTFRHMSQSGWKMVCCVE